MEDISQQVNPTPSPAPAPPVPPQPAPLPDVVPQSPRKKFLFTLGLVIQLLGFLLFLLWRYIGPQFLSTDLSQNMAFIAPTLLILIGAFLAPGIVSVLSTLLLTIFLFVLNLGSVLVQVWAPSVRTDPGIIQLAPLSLAFFVIAIPRWRKPKRALTLVASIIVLLVLALSGRVLIKAQGETQKTLEGLVIQSSTSQRAVALNKDIIRGLASYYWEVGQFPDSLSDDGFNSQAYTVHEIKRKEANVRSANPITYSVSDGGKAFSLCIKAEDGSKLCDDQNSASFRNGFRSYTRTNLPRLLNRDYLDKNLAVPNSMSELAALKVGNPLPMGYRPGYKWRAEHFQDPKTNQLLEYKPLLDGKDYELCITYEATKTDPEKRECYNNPVYR